MAFFLRKLIFFIAFVFIITLLFQLAISFRLKDKNIRGYDNLEQTSDVNADLVFIGSSRCWAHFAPRFFDSTFKIKSVNIGMDGHSQISSAIVRLKYYLSKNKSPRFAILNFDPFVYAGSETDNNDFAHKDSYARYSFLPDHKDLLIVNYFKFNIVEKYIPLYAIFKYRILGDCLSVKNKNSYTENGYERHDEKWDTILNPVTDKMKKSFFNETEKQKIVNALNELKRLCSKNNIKLLCIQTPVYKSIFENIAFSNTATLCKLLEIPFIDTDVEYIRNDINYFYNSFHLNTLGVLQMNLLLKKNKALTSFFNE